MTPIFVTRRPSGAVEDPDCLHCRAAALVQERAAQVHAGQVIGEITMLLSDVIASLSTPELRQSAIDQILRQVPQLVAETVAETVAEFHAQDATRAGHA